MHSPHPHGPYTMTGSPARTGCAGPPIVWTQPAFSWPRVKGSVNDRDPAGLPADADRSDRPPHPDLHQYLPGPGFGHRHVPELARLLPFDELEGLDGASSL